MTKRPTQGERILSLLRDGRWHTTAEILAWCPSIVHSRISSLRDGGHEIEHRTTGKGAAGSEYRLVTALSEAGPDASNVRTVPPVSLSAVALAGASKATGREATWGASADGNHPVASAPASVTQLDLFGAAA